MEIIEETVFIFVADKVVVAWANKRRTARAAIRDAFDYVDIFSPCS